MILEDWCCLACLALERSGNQRAWGFPTVRSWRVWAESSWQGRQVSRGVARPKASGLCSAPQLKSTCPQPQPPHTTVESGKGLGRIQPQGRVSTRGGWWMVMPRASEWEAGP